jgi:hypothetical protein
MNDAISEILLNRDPSRTSMKFPSLIVENGPSSEMTDDNEMTAEPNNTGAAVVSRETAMNREIVGQAKVDAFVDSDSGSDSGNENECEEDRSLTTSGTTVAIQVDPAQSGMETDPRFLTHSPATVIQLTAGPENTDSGPGNQGAAAPNQGIGAALPNQEQGSDQRFS